MNCRLLDLDVPIGPTEVGHQFVVISRNVNHMRALAGFSQNFLDHVVVLLWPVDPATQRPDIDQVAHNVERIEIVLAQKIEQGRCVATPRAQMRVGYPRGSIMSRRQNIFRRLAE